MGINSGRTIPREPDVPEPERHSPGFGGDGRVHRTSAFVEDAERLTGVPNAVRRDHRRLQQRLHSQAKDEVGLPDWMANAQIDRDTEDGTIVFPAPSMKSSPGLDYLGRPTGRRRGGRSR